MKNFKGFDDWIEVFRTGTHTDSAGNIRDWKEDDLKKISENYNPEKNEAPIVIGHPADNAPAYGWVEKVKTEGGILWAKFKDVIPEFSDMVKKGLFKKRSISLHPDLMLRHIGFLGAMPPAVKGLADLSFSDNDDAIVFEFSETSPWTWNTIAGVFRKMREWLIEKEGKEIADSIIPDWDIEGIKDAEKKATSGSGVQPEFGEHKSAKAKKEEETMTFKEFMEIFKFWKETEKNPDIQLPGGSGQGTASGKDKTFTEADIEAAKILGAEAERKKAETEFAEKDRTAKRKARTKEISDFCEGLVKDGKIPPSWIDSGLVNFMQSLDVEVEIEFSEGAKKSPLKYFQEFLEGLGKSSIFQELVTKEKAGYSSDFAEAKKEQETGESIAAKVN